MRTAYEYEIVEGPDGLRQDLLLRAAEKQNELFFYQRGQLIGTRQRAVGYLNLRWRTSPRCLARHLRDQFERDALTWQPESGAAALRKT